VSEIDSRSVENLLQNSWSDGTGTLQKIECLPFRAIIDAAGGTPVSENGSSTSRWDHLYESGVAHEVGTVRMGSGPQDLGPQRFCQAHDVKNLFVTDGACFTTNPDKNPTPTILPLSWRASEYLLDQAKKFNL
jgi:choline dehydrogenase-like flavoprotein